MKTIEQGKGKPRSEGEQTKDYIYGGVRVVSIAKQIHKQRVEADEDMKQGDS